MNCARNTGRTTRQLQSAPKGAIFVWVNEHSDYPRILALKLKRDDLIVRPFGWLSQCNIHNLPPRWPIVLDHACRTRLMSSDHHLDRFMLQLLRKRGHFDWKSTIKPR